MEKNFLETINNDYPESFKEEKFVESEKKSKLPIIISVIVIALLLICGYFIFFNKKVVMEDFVSKSRENLNVWVKENGINSNNIIFTYEYDLTYDENIIISQSVDAGKKISKNKVITFVVSKGADPDEEIKFPDIKSMDLNEIKKWISDNKLSNIKISYEYSDDISKDSVISYNLRNINESEFVRSSQLTVVISKGKKQKSQVTVDNFVGKSYDAIVSWAAEKNVIIVKTDVFSNKEIGEITSQSVSAGTKIKEEDTIYVNVSKGEASYIPSLVGKTKSYANTWALDSDIKVIIQEEYNDTVEKNKVINQNIQAGSYIDKDDVLVLTVSLGKPYLEDYKGKSIDELLEWVEEINESGCNVNVKINEDAYYSEVVSKDGIVSQNKKGYINLNDTIVVTLSLGSKILVDRDYIGAIEDDVKTFCEGLNCIYKYEKSSKQIGTVLDIKIGNKTLKPDMYINSSDTIVVTISEGN